MAAAGHVFVPYTGLITAVKPHVLMEALVPTGRSGENNCHKGTSVLITNLGGWNADENTGGDRWTAQWRPVGFFVGNLFAVGHSERVM